MTRRPGSFLFRVDVFSSLALIARGGLRFQEIVDLVLEPRDRVLAELDVQRKFSDRLEPGDVYARPGDAALAEGWIIEESSAGLFSGNFGTRHVSPRELMSRGVYLYERTPEMVPINHRIIRDSHRAEKTAKISDV